MKTLLRRNPSCFDEFINKRSEEWKREEGQALDQHSFRFFSSSFVAVFVVAAAHVVVVADVRESFIPQQSQMAASIAEAQARLQSKTTSAWCGGGIAQRQCSCLWIYRPSSPRFESRLRCILSTIANLINHNALLRVRVNSGSTLIVDQPHPVQASGKLVLTKDYFCFVNYLPSLRSIVLTP